MNPSEAGPLHQSIAVHVTAESRHWKTAVPDAETMCQQVAVATISALNPGIGYTEASVVLADDARLRSLNRAYRERDEATDVLSFPLHENVKAAASAQSQPLLLGDVIIAYETAAADAAASSKALSDHLSHLLVHGMLHLFGYDHLTEVEANEMERLETRILGDLGLPDPYGPDKDLS